MADEKTKAKIVGDLYVFIKGETKEQNRYINLITRLDAGSGAFPVKNNRVTREEWIEAFDLLESRTGALREKSGKKGAGDNEKSPF